MFLSASMLVNSDASAQINNQMIVI